MRMLDKFDFSLFFIAVLSNSYYIHDFMFPVDKIVKTSIQIPNGIAKKLFFQRARNRRRKGEE
jgi:hypothetical protein